MFGKFLLSFAGLALCGASAFAFIQAPGGHRPRVGEFSRGDAREHGRLRELLTRRREAIRGRIAERLGVTSAQREQLRAQADCVRPIAEQFRAEARAILQRARETTPNSDRAATREQTRAALKALFERYYAQLEPGARSLVGSLTPEQRTKLERHAAKRGRTLDEERMKRAAAFLMLRRARDGTTAPR